MKFLIDENMSRKWCRELQKFGHQCDHWLDVGRPGSPDTEVMEYARKVGAIVLTCDLDFGDILAATGGGGPSVLQLRPGKMRPDALMSMVFVAINQHQVLLKSGALLTIDQRRARINALPLA